MADPSDGLWTRVEAQLLDQVFYAFDPDEVRAESDLAAAGFLDSLSIVAVLEVIIQESGNEGAMGEAVADDFRNLGSIKSLCARL